MIVEFFGPPGAGKTTLARALLNRLRERGYTSEIVLPHQPDKVLMIDPVGLVYAAYRIIQAIVDFLTIALHPIANRKLFGVAIGLVQLLPPKNVIWFIRFGQYILRLSKIWHRSSSIDPIVIFDQAFVQAVCSLGVFNRSIGNHSIGESALARALSLIPHADIVIYVKVEREVQQDRLQERLRSVPMMARLFEASHSTNLQFSPVIEQVVTLLDRQGRPVCFACVENLSTIDLVLDQIEREIVAKLQSNSELTGRSAADVRKPDEQCLICDTGVQNVAFPLVPVMATAEPRSTADRSLNRKRDRFAHTSIWALLIYVGGAGLTCAVQFLVARLLHAEGYGIYSYVWAWVSLLSYGATLGFAAFTLRFTSAYQDSGQWSLMYGSIRFAISRSLAAALSVSSVGLLILWLRWDHLEPKFAISMTIGLVTIPLITLHLVGASIIRVFGGFIAAILPERVFRDGVLLAIIGLAVWGTLWPVSVKMVLAASFVSTAATLAFVIFIAVRLWPDRIKRIKPRYLPRNWWNFAFPVMVMMGLEIIMMRTGVLVLGWSGRVSDAGHFALAFNLAMLVQLSRAAVGIYFSPAASQLHARRDFTGLETLFSRATVLSTAGGAILALPVLFLTSPLLRMFGRDFVDDSNIAQCLVIGQFLAAAAGPQQNLLTMTGHERSTAAIMLAFTTLTVIGALAAVHYGAIGVAIVTSGTLVAWNFAMAIYIDRRIGIKPGLLLAIADFQARRRKAMIAVEQKPEIRQS